MILPELQIVYQMKWSLYQAWINYGQ